MTKEQKNLKDVWNVLADSWTNFRVKPWDEITEFSKTIENGLVLDIGCGNCRNLVPFIEKKLKCVGMDFSQNMIKQSKLFIKKRNIECHLVIGESKNLPFKNKVADVIICNAVIHDIYLKEERSESIKEMRRIVKDTGKTLVSIWNRYQTRFILPLIKSLFTSNFADIWVDWNYRGKVYKRFYHLYSKNEFNSELKNVGFKIKKTWKDKNGNIWSEVEK